VDRLVFQDLSAQELSELNDTLGRITRRPDLMLEEDIVKERLHRGRPARS